MKTVKFILSGFWTWAGAVGLIAVAAAGTAAIIKAARPTRKIEAYRIGSRWHVKIEGATAGDTVGVMSMTQEPEQPDEQDAAGVDA